MRGIGRRILLGLGVLVLVAAVALGGLILYVVGGPSRLLARDLPQTGDPALGVDYRADVDCLLQFRAGDTVWRLEPRDGWPPPEVWPGIREVFSTWSVPGIVRFIQSDRAVFRAQSDGSLWDVRPASGRLSEARCI